MLVGTAVLSRPRMAIEAEWGNIARPVLHILRIIGREDHAVGSKSNARFHDQSIRLVSNIGISPNENAQVSSNLKFLGDTGFNDIQMARQIMGLKS